MIKSDSKDMMLQEISNNAVLWNLIESWNQCIMVFHKNIKQQQHMIIYIANNKT